MFNLRKIEQLRKKLGMTQAKLSEESGVTIQTISYIENGHRAGDEVRVDTIEKLAKALKVKPVELLK